MNNIGTKIYELRLKNNLSQDILAEKLGVSRQAISKWENSQSVPELEKIVLMSEIFGVSIDYIVKGKDVPHQTSTQEEPTDGFSKRKIKEILGFIFLGLGLLMLIVNLIFAIPLIVEGVFLINYKDTDFSVIMGYSIFIVLLVPLFTMFVIGVLYVVTG